MVGAAGNFSCLNVEFPKSGDAPASAPESIDFGLWGYRTKAVAVGEDYIWIADVCRSYTDIGDEIGYSYDWDKLTEALQGIVISIIAIGGVTAIGACVAPCFPCHPWLWKFYGFSFVCMSVLQGVTLMILDSDVCVNNPIMQLIEQESPNLRQFYPETCEWGSGFKLAISATVFWGVAGIIALLIPSPQPESTCPYKMTEEEREKYLEGKDAVDDEQPSDENSEEDPVASPEEEEPAAPKEDA